MLNERLGKYLLLERIPGSGTAETYLAKSSVADGLNKFFIIKKTLRTSTAKIEIPSLNHSNILAVFDSGIDRGFFFTVMDYFESYGLTQILADFVQVRCQLGIDQCLYIIRETAAALIYAHNHKAHGKISTDSILVGLDGAVKVVDFEFFSGVDKESQTDLKKLLELLRELLGENIRASTELEELCTKVHATASDLYREVNRHLNTNYPEFSSPEFGEQLIKFYSAGVQNQRAKLLDYAKIDVQRSVPVIVPDIYDVPEKSMIVRQDTSTFTSVPEGFAEIPKKGTNPEVSFENINRENPFVPGPVVVRRPAPRPVQPPAAETESQKPSHLSDVMLLLSVALLLTLICYTYNATIKRYSKKMVDSVRLSEDHARYAKERETESENYSKGVISRMDASRQLSYVNIRVLGSPSDARLFINGKELLERAPLRKYPIFASQYTLISVLSAKTRRSDARRIFLRPGQVVDVTLSLRPD